MHFLFFVTYTPGDYSVREMPLCRLPPPPAPVCSLISNLLNCSRSHHLPTGMTQRVRKLKTLSTKQQQRAVLISLAKPQHGLIYRCKETPFCRSAAPHAFLEVFLCLSVTLLQTGLQFKGSPDLKSQTWFPWPWGKLSSCSSSGCIWTVPLPHHPLAVPNKHTVTSKNVPQLWSHPGHFHPLSLLWRNTPNTELMDSCLSLNSCVLLPLWNVFFIFCCLSPSYTLYCWRIAPSQKSYYKITYKIYLIFMLLLYIPCGDT